MLETLGEVLIPIVVGIVIALVGAALAWLLVTLAKSGKFKTLESAIGVLKANSYTVSAALQQEFVERWKADADDGKLTEAEIAKLKAMALQRVMDITAPALVSLLLAAGTDVKLLVQSAVEEWVGENHKI